MISDEPEADELASNFSTTIIRSRRSSISSSSSRELTRNLIAFWLLGLCNNFGYVVMLSAAKDILERSAEPTPNSTATTGCIPDIKDLKCSTMSTGAVLLGDILPSLAIKLLAPFALPSVPYSLRHCAVILLQAASYVTVAYSQTVSIGLLGVVFASLGAGLGEVTYLSLSSHFHNEAISSWSSGTGGAGIFGALAFAALTDHRLIGLSARQALLGMLLVPATLALAYWQILVCPSSVHGRPDFAAGVYQRLLGSSSTPVSGPSTSASSSTDDLQSLLLPRQERSFRRSFCAKIRLIKPLLRFMLPLCAVYFGEYFINQGLLELLIFDCDHSFGLSPTQQYRWNQVLYQLGVFISRSSLKLLPLRPALIPLLAILQTANAFLLFGESLFHFRLLPHLLLLMALVLYEGLLGGAAYVNTFSAIHRIIPKKSLEFSISFVAISDSVGIVLAGFAAIQAHNFICASRGK